jgi:hypothetical protein
MSQLSKKIRKPNANLTIFVPAKRFQQQLTDFRARSEKGSVCSLWLSTGQLRWVANRA